MDIEVALIIEASNEDDTGLWELDWALRSVGADVTEEESIPRLTVALTGLLEGGLVTLHETTEFLVPLRQVSSSEWSDVLSRPDSWAPAIHVGPWYPVAATDAGERLDREASIVVMRFRSSGSRG